MPGYIKIVTPPEGEFAVSIFRFLDGLIFPYTEEHGGQFLVELDLFVALIEEHGPPACLTFFQEVKRISDRQNRNAPSQDVLQTFISVPEMFARKVKLH